MRWKTSGWAILGGLWRVMSRQSLALSHVLARSLLVRTSPVSSSSSRIAPQSLAVPFVACRVPVPYVTLPSTHPFRSLVTRSGTNRRWVEVEWRVNGERSDRRPKRGWNGVTRNRRNSHVVLLPLSTRTATPVEDGRVRWGERHEGARVPCVPPRYCRSLCSLPFSIPPRSSRRRKERA